MVRDPAEFALRSGVYGNTSLPAAGQFSSAFCQAYPNFKNPAAAYVYANQPQDIQICDPNYATFKPDIPPCNPPTVVYQYTVGTGNGCAVGGHMVDYDLANAAGLAGMW